MNRYANCSGLLTESVASFSTPHQPEKDRLSGPVSLFLQGIEVGNVFIQSRYKMDEEHVGIRVLQDSRNGMIKDDIPAV